MPLDRFIAEQTDGTRWSPKIRERVLALSGVAPKSGESVRAAIHRQRAKMARTIADRCWRTLMNTDAATDPELLDWLACELMQSTQISCCHLEDPMPEPWEMKAYLRTIVTCAAYRSR
jgi:hypothetical protein